MGTCLQIESLLVGEHLVPEVAATVKGLFKELRLLLSGIEPCLNGDVLETLSAFFEGFFFPCHRFTSIALFVFQRPENLFRSKCFPMQNGEPTVLIFDPLELQLHARKFPAFGVMLWDSTSVFFVLNR